MITGNIIGGRVKNPETFILVDDDGNEYVAVMTEEEVELTAGVNDIRLGKTAALHNGLRVGEKFIPSYHTNEGVLVIPAGERYRISVLDEYDAYDFTKLQAIICDYNSTIADSVYTDKVSMEGNVYQVQSLKAISAVSKIHDDKVVDFGIINDTNRPKILRYFTYKETD